MTYRMQKYCYSIPKIKWQTSIMDDEGIARVITFSSNTFIEYFIHKNKDNEYRCYYGSGRYKEFTSSDEAKEWVEQVHYPAQVEKYFEIYGVIA